MARRSLSLFQKSRVPATLAATDLKKNELVYFFKRSAKFGLWESPYIRDCHLHFAVLSPNQYHIGKPIRAAYEDIRKAPTSPLLQELDRIEFTFPRSYSVVDEDYEDSEIPVTADIPEIYPELAKVARNCTYPLTKEKPCQSQSLPDMPAPEAGDDHLEIDKEWSNWVAHSSLPTGSSVQKPHRNNKLLEDVSLYAVERCNALFGTEYQTSKEASQGDINRTHEPPEPQKDIDGTALMSPPQLPHSLQSSEQLVLHEMKGVVGDGPVSEFKLQFAPRWIIDKAIADEKSNYHDAGAYRELHFRQTPKGTNVITSHHFFQIKNHAEEGRLRLKCRLVPYGNRDREETLCAKTQPRHNSQSSVYFFHWQPFCPYRSPLSTKRVLTFRLESSLVIYTFVHHQAGHHRHK